MRCVFCVRAMFLPVGSCIVFLINSSWISDVEHLFSFAVLREGLLSVVWLQVSHSATTPLLALCVLFRYLVLI